MASPSDPGKAASSSGGARGRVVLQRCLSARLMVQPATDDTPPQYVHINTGIIAFVCFLKGADEGIVDKMGKFITQPLLISLLNFKIWVYHLYFKNLKLYIQQ